MVDLVARGRLDPAEMRRRNLVTRPTCRTTAASPTWTPATRCSTTRATSRSSSAACSSARATTACARRWRHGARGGECVGLGVTAFIEMGNPGVFEQARVVAEPDGTFTAHVGVASVGQGVETVLSQVAADLLEVPIERVAVRYQDTATVPEGQGAFSSRATVWGGYAIAGAVPSSSSRRATPAAEHFEAPPEIVRVEAGVARSRRASASSRCRWASSGSRAFYRYEPPGGSHILVGGNVGMVEVDPRVRRRQAAELRHRLRGRQGGQPGDCSWGQVQGSAVQGFGGRAVRGVRLRPRRPAAVDELPRLRAAHRGRDADHGRADRRARPHDRRGPARGRQGRRGGRHHRCRRDRRQRGRRRARARRRRADLAADHARDGARLAPEP